MRIHQGVDMVRTSKLRDVCLRHAGFITEVFTERERRYCLSKRDPYVHFAGRFAAKEACLKALGRGLRTAADPILKDIEIAPEASGRPTLSLSGWAERASRRLGIDRLAVSISHSGDYAVSAVVLAGTDAQGCDE